jgi:hypothetical protein
MVKLGFDRVYQSIMTYAPPQVKEILAMELPRIEQNIEAEAQEFGRQLGEFIATQTQDLVSEIEGLTGNFKQRLEEIADEAGKSTKASMVKVNDAVKELKKELDEYETRWRKVGVTLKDMVNRGIHSAGIPLKI